MQPCIFLQRLNLCQKHTRWVLVLSLFFWWWRLPAISAHRSFREQLLLVDAAFSMAASSCFCCLLSRKFYRPGQLLATLSTKVRCWASSALSKCALHRAVFRMRAACHIPSGHKWSCSLCLCCDLSAFFPAPGLLGGHRLGGEAASSWSWRHRIWYQADLSSEAGSAFS